MSNPYWKQSELDVSHNDITVNVNNHMTEYEAGRFRDLADRLLAELDSLLKDNPVDLLTAYGSQRRIGVRISPGHDPLGNGIITGNVDGFDVEAVSPVNHEQVYIRFQEQSDD